MKMDPGTRSEMIKGMAGTPPFKWLKNIQTWLLSDPEIRLLQLKSVQTFIKNISASSLSQSASGVTENLLPLAKED